MIAACQRGWRQPDEGPIAVNLASAKPQWMPGYSPRRGL